MKGAVLFLFLVLQLYAELDLKSYVGYEYKTYLKRNDNIRSHNSAVTFQSQIKKEFEESAIVIELNALKDFAQEQRDYFHITEAYYTMAFDNYDLDFGKKVIFQGSLEAYNLVDIFNRQNYQRDLLSDFKEGSIMASLAYYFEDDSSLKFYIKSFEEDIKFPDKSSPYYPFLNEAYSSKLEYATDHESPSFLVSYQKSYDDDFVADLSGSIFYGYDNHILYNKTNATYHPFLFQSAKLMTTNTFVTEEFLYKVEGAYTTIVNDGHYDLKDFYELGFGVEYTIEQIVENHNLSFLAEYYASNEASLNSFDNDLFLALRYALNDKDSSEFLGGYIKDLEKSEQSAYIKYSGRLTDTLNISADIRYMDTQSYLNEHLRIGCELKYYF